MNGVPFLIRTKCVIGESEVNEDSMFKHGIA